jgi:hypothetical protein
LAEGLARSDGGVCLGYRLDLHFTFGSEANSERKLAKKKKTQEKLAVYLDKILNDVLLDDPPRTDVTFECI